MQQNKSTSGGDRTRQIEQLTALIGKPVTVQNRASVDLALGVHINLHGILEEPDDEGQFLVRIKESYDGSSTIGFLVSDLEREDGVYKQPSGRWEITLK